MDTPIPLGRLTIIGLLSDHGFTQSHGTAPGFAVDLLDREHQVFQVRHVPYPGTTPGATIAAMAAPMREAGWLAWIDHDTDGPRVIVKADTGPTAGQRALAETVTAPYLAGRLVGLAVHLGEHTEARQSLRYAAKIASGGLPAVTVVISNLDGMISRELARHDGELPSAYRAAHDDIRARLDLLPAGWPPLPWPAEGQAEFMLAQSHQSAALSRATA
jgi:hypothetical protein